MRSNLEKDLSSFGWLVAQISRNRHRTRKEDPDPLQDSTFDIFVDDGLTNKSHPHDLDKMYIPILANVSLILIHH